MHVKKCRASKDLKCVALCSMVTYVSCKSCLDMSFHWVCISLGTGTGESDGASFPPRPIH